MCVFCLRALFSSIYVPTENIFACGRCAVCIGPIARSPGALTNTQHTIRSYIHLTNTDFYPVSREINPAGAIGSSSMPRAGEREGVRRTQAHDLLSHDRRIRQFLRVYSPHMCPTRHVCSVCVCVCVFVIEMVRHAQRVCIQLPVRADQSNCGLLLCSALVCHG